MISKKEKRKRTGDFQRNKNGYKTKFEKKSGGMIHIMDEEYSKDWVRLDMMLNKKTGEIHYVGGDRELGDERADREFIGKQILLNNLYETPIYTITTIRYGGDMRTVGFVYNLEAAKTIIVENYGDIYEEGYYPFALIEEVRGGIYNVNRKEFWYKWSHETHKYEPTSKPDHHQRSICFSMG